MEHLEDALARAQAGDTNAMAELYHAYAGPLLAYLMTQVRRREDAEDLLGEVFVSAMRDLGRFEGTISGFRAWLYRIASNRAVDLARLNARRPEEPLAVALERPGEADPAAEALGRVDRERLWRAVKALILSCAVRNSCVNAIHSAAAGSCEPLACDAGTSARAASFSRSIASRSAEKHCRSRSSRPASSADPRGSRASNHIGSSWPNA